MTKLISILYKSIFITFLMCQARYSMDRQSNFIESFILDERHPTSITSLPMSFKSLTDSEISKLPNEIKVNIFRLLPQMDFLNSYCVCHEWKEICKIAGSEKTLNLSQKRIEKNQGNNLINLPFSSLILDNCALDYQILVTLSHSSQYKMLILSNNDITDKGATALAIGNLTYLASLNLSKNKIRYLGTKSLATGNLVSLTCLNLSDNRISNAGVQALSTGKLISLTSLDLSKNYIEDEGVESLCIGNLASLTHLNLSQNTISNNGANMLVSTEKFTSLISLNLSRNPIEKVIIEKLKDKFVSKFNPLF